MKNAVQNWLQKRGGLPGILACGVQFSDRTCLSQSNTSRLTSDKLDQALHQISDAGIGLSKQRITTTHLLWTFSEGQLHCAIRPDGSLFGVMTPLDIEAYDPGLIERIIEEFLKLGKT